MVEYRVALVVDSGQIVARAQDHQNLLEVMRLAGLAVRKSCRNGVCGLCKCRLLSGEITYHWRQPHGLWQKHIDQGLILPCIAFPRGDLVLDQIPLVAAEDSPKQP